MFTVLIALALLLVLGVLFTGIIGMVRGGEFNEKYGNKLMQMRVLAQAVAVLLLFLAFLFDGN
ncbi:MAG: twin transmembrane helix small protein [Minwuia sp.]|uniref:twin transmembrane helix small protein n=1 Tax=Minwuia sp. TaxID=2493630 RepID=UPI003A877647